MMSNNNLNNKVLDATKWSGITEIAAKLVSPITTMILARLLTPDAFGVLVTAQMVISFAEIFTDAGFQKYLIQHEFADEDDRSKSTAVAFWSNLSLSLLLWMVICIFANPIARLVGCEGNGIVIAVSCSCIPLSAFSSIQMALFKRDFDFKTLFWVRIAGILVPLVVTIPLAFLTRSYWSLIVGMIALNLFNAIILTVKSKWKPRWYYSFQRFKDMFSFTMWSMLESISIWLTGYIDIFIVGSVLNAYYLGIYRTAISTVGSIFAIVTSSTTPILFSALSRLQDDGEEFKNMFLKFQKLVSICVLPIGFCIYIFQKEITFILLGEQWLEAAYLIGLWGLSNSLVIVLSHYSSEVFRAKGKPKYSLFCQLIHLVFLIPTVLISVRYGFNSLCLFRTIIRFQMVVTALILVKKISGIKASIMLRNIFPSLMGASSILLVDCFVSNTDSLLISLAKCILYVILYLSVISLFPQERLILKSSINKIRYLAIKKQ